MYRLSFAEVRTLYTDFGNLKALASKLNLSSKTTRRVLDGCGIDYLKDLEEQHRAGDSWSSIWICPVFVPLQVLVYATFRSKATGLFQPNAEWRRRGL